MNRVITFCSLIGLGIPKDQGCQAETPDFQQNYTAEIGVLF